jgi:hypothetical protein
MTKVSQNACVVNIQVHFANDLHKQTGSFFSISIPRALQHAWHTEDALYIDDKCYNECYWLCERDFRWRFKIKSNKHFERHLSHFLGLDSYSIFLLFWGHIAKSSVLHLWPWSHQLFLSFLPHHLSLLCQTMSL